MGLISEWLNLVSKWFLFGERPFWWVFESGFSSKEEVKIQQFSVSCETGPGSPSGHCMITGAALWPIARALTALLSRRSSGWLVRLVPFTLYFLLLLAVGLSRIFILAHFPHQVLGGILAGAALGWLLETRVPEERELNFYVCASLSLLLSALLTFWGMMALGIDLTWSIHLATKWCATHEWIRIDTRPFASLSRDVGTALGLGLALHSSYTCHQQHRPSRKERALCAATALAVLQVLSDAGQLENVTVWYGLNFLRYATLPWVVVALLPWLACSLSSTHTPLHQE
uniref:glucose-6-phosphatase n=1 Tax=Sphenodon punctatus TaxID=8508 RepID=A0A8D0H643_SPHPU